MASHKDINVGDTNWVIRVDGKDVRVKVLEKLPKASGRGYEFRCKRMDNGNRVIGRNLTRGSGAFRRPGESPKTTGFAKGKKPPARRASSKPARSAYASPPPTTTSYTNPPASAFFSQVQEPGMSRSPSPSAGSSNGGRSSASGLGSLRGRGRASRSAAPSPARSSDPAPSQARREIERNLKHANLQPLVVELVKSLISSDGTEFSIQQIYGRVMANHRMRSFGMPFRS